MTLAEHLAKLDMSKAELARRLGVTQTTIYNWINTGRVGSRAHRFELARLIHPQLPEREAVRLLWPDIGFDSDFQVIGWPRFTDIPESWWVERIIGVNHNLDILVGSGDGWFTKYGARLQQLLAARDRDEQSVNLRILTADPMGSATEQRDGIESSQPGSTLAPGSLGGRVQNGLNIASQVVEEVTDGEVRRYREDWWPGSIVYRFDSDLICCGYLYGTRSPDSWAVHLNEHEHPEPFWATVRSFGLLWDDSRPVG